MVAKLIHSDVPAPFPFADGETTFVKEVQNIVERVSTYLELNNWTYINPVTEHCVWGVSWFPPCQPIKGLTLDCSCPNCDAGGALMGPFSYGYGFCNSQIQVAFKSYPDAYAYCRVRYPPNLVLNRVFTLSGVAFAAAAGIPFIGKEDFKVLTYATISDLWWPLTAEIVRNRCQAADAEHLPLLYQVLHGGTCSLPASLYTKMLDSAPCFGNNRYDHNHDWSNGDRIYDGPNHTRIYFQTESVGVDYMLYFNLYLLANPQYLDPVPNGYRFIPPTELCPEVLNKYDYTESDVKNFLASDYIQAFGTYRDASST